MSKFVGHKVKVETKGAGSLEGVLCFIGKSHHDGYGALILRNNGSHVIVRNWKMIQRFNSGEKET